MQLYVLYIVWIIPIYLIDIWGGGGERIVSFVFVGWDGVRGVNHKVHIYVEYHSVCPIVDTGNPSPPTSSPTSECVRVPLKEQNEGGTNSPAGEGVGESQFGRLE